MILNLLAIFVFFAALLTGMILLWRRLPRASAVAVGEIYCLSCWTPARQFAADNFVCPTCGRDARVLGLAAKRPAAHADPFWRFIWFTAILSFLALISTAVLLNNSREVYGTSTESDYWSDGKANIRLDLTAHGTSGSSDRPFTGELEGDLVSVDGDLITLEIQSPSLRYEVVSDSGSSVVPLSQGAFDEEAILRWMSIAKLNPTDALVRHSARATYEQICHTLKLTPKPATFAERGSSNGSMGGTYSGLQTVAPVLMPVCVIAWSAAWLIGVWLILRLAMRRQSSSQPVARQEAAT